MVHIQVIHGPNLNLLGQREPEVYGHWTLADVDDALAEVAKELGVELETFQSNHEGALLDFIEEASGRVSGFVVNPGAFTHTSVALRDALCAMDGSFVEVHCSNLARREEFRRRSLLSDVAVGVISGFGPMSYMLGLRALVTYLRRSGGD